LIMLDALPAGRVHACHGRFEQAERFICHINWRMRCEYSVRLPDFTAGDL